MSVRSACDNTTSSNYSAGSCANARNPLGAGREAPTDTHASEQQRMRVLRGNPIRRTEQDCSTSRNGNYYAKNKKIISMEPPDSREDDGMVEPIFWLVSACVLGLCGFVAFVSVAAMHLPFSFISGEPPCIAAGSCAGFFFLFIFFFYALSSSEDRFICCIADGFVGAVPYVLLGAPIGYMYSALVLMIANLIDDTTVSLPWRYAILSLVPAFLVLFIPMFILSMQVQEASAIAARIFKGIRPKPKGYIPLTKGVISYLFLAVRRFIVGYAMGVGLASYYSITSLIIGWLVYELRKAIESRLWIPIAIVASVVFLLFAVLILLGCLRTVEISHIFAPWIRPLAGWSRMPLRSAYFPRYHVGVTVKQMIRETNRTTRRANKYYVCGDRERAEELYYESGRRRAEIERNGIELSERDSYGFERMNAGDHSEVNSQARQRVM